jgi:hypothetical protein
MAVMRSIRLPVSGRKAIFASRKNKKREEALGTASLTRGEMMQAIKKFWAAYKQASLEVWTLHAKSFRDVPFRPL